MEILITSFSLLTLAVVVMLIGTRGIPCGFSRPSAKRGSELKQTGCPWL